MTEGKLSMRASGCWEGEVNDLQSINGLHARGVISSGKLACMHAEPRRLLLMRLLYAKTFLEPIHIDRRMSQYIIIFDTWIM
jgi:hypothetical protein